MTCRRQRVFSFGYPAQFKTGSARRVLVEFPSPAKRGQRLVPVPLWLAPKLAFYLAVRD